MNFKRLSAVNRFVIILLCVAVAMSLVVFMGCQDPNEPGLDGINETATGPQSASMLLVESGPELTVTNEYMDPIEWPWAGTIMRIPNGVPLIFCWSAKQSAGGGEIAAYRYGWDILDLDDPEAWDVFVTPYDGVRSLRAIKGFPREWNSFLCRRGFR